MAKKDKSKDKPKKGKDKDKGKGKGKGKGKDKAKAKAKDKKGKQHHGHTQACQADKYVLYQRSVQEPEADIEFMQKVFEDHFGRPARHLREDFCAAANQAMQWIRQHPENEAWGVDLDPEPLAWGMAHNAKDLSPEQLGRLHLIEGNVLDSREPKVDIVTAQNFSYFIFKQRELLLSYFKAARAGLKDEGLFVVDLFGGPEAQQVQEEETDHDDFSYVWDQDAYDPISNEILCHIHFRFPDGSEQTKAFTYDWRLWTICEVRELMAEAGFSASEAYWEGTDDDGEGNGEFTKTAKTENEDAWIAYVVGVA